MAIFADNSHDTPINVPLTLKRGGSIYRLQSCILSLPPRPKGAAAFAPYSRSIMHQSPIVSDSILYRPFVDLDAIAIFLDVDGTILDIAPKPQDVRVPQELRDALQCIVPRVGGAAAFISGRPLADIDRIFAPLKLPAVGGHGAEIRFCPDGEIQRQAIAPFDDELRQRFATIGNLDPRIIVEDKQYSIALHYRLVPTLAAEVMKSVVSICDKWGAGKLDILPGKSVIEVKPRGFNKGTALRQVMAHPLFKGRRPVFVGDDTTDEAAFAVLPEFSGIGFSVGGTMPGTSFNFDGPQDVRVWLERICAGARAEVR